MDILKAIAQRRSIRRYRDTPVPDEIVRRLLYAATQAPSGKNRQPWRFVVVRADRRAEMVRVMRQGIDKLKALGVDIGSAEGTARVMEQAPVTLFVFNANLENTDRETTFLDLMGNSVDVQSIDAAIQNLLLVAQDLGIGTLWICDVFYAYEELCAWLGDTHQMIAAVALGVPDEQPDPRPRRSVDEVSRWL